MLIRIATLNDIPFIMEMVAWLIPEMIASGNLQWDTNYPNTGIFTDDVAHNYLWVAEVDGVVAGVAAITTNQETEYTQVGWDITELAIVTHRLAVSPYYRGLGIAAALLNQAELEAIRRGIKALRVDTNTHNKATQKLFPKLGYVFAGEIGFDFRPGLRFYCYEKRLD